MPNRVIRLAYHDLLLTGITWGLVKTVLQWTGFSSFLALHQKVSLDLPVTNVIARREKVDRNAFITTRVVISRGFESARLVLLHEPAFPRQLLGRRGSCVGPQD